MSELSTGITALDRNLGGGIPEGFVLSLFSPAASDTERFLYQFIGKNPDYKPIYFTTEQSELLLEESISQVTFLDQMPQIVDLTEENKPLDEMNDYFKKLPDNSIVIIDSIDRFELKSRSRYQLFLNNLQKQISESDSLAVLYGSNNPVAKETRLLTSKLSDGVFETDLLKQSEELVSYLSITKFRGIDSVNDRTRLLIGKDRVTIDTSRDIA